MSDVKSAVAAAVLLNNGQYPRIIIIGALGRCGTGAVDLCRQAGMPENEILKCDMAETARGGPFEEIAAADIFINCIYLREQIPPFVTRQSLSLPGRKLRVACDVSCDPTDPMNPVPLYTVPTTFTEPTSLVDGVSGDGPELTITAIDHLRSLVAREASDAFSNLLLPSLQTLNRRGKKGFGCARRRHSGTMSPRFRNTSEDLHSKDDARGLCKYGSLKFLRWVSSSRETCPPKSHDFLY